MGDTRVEGNGSRYVSQPDEGCDDHNLTCGDNQSRGQPLDETPEIKVPDPKPVAVATVAANMSESALRAEYGKMTDAELDAAHRTLEHKLTTTTYAGAAEDQTRLRVLEDVVASRPMPKSPAPEPEVEGWRNPFHAQEHGYGVEAGGAGHKGEHLTLFDVHARVGTAHTGMNATVLHLQGKHDFGSFDVSGSGDAGSVSYDVGTHNADGSVGAHAGGGATAVGGEVTIHKAGVGSVTLGASGGVSVEASEGYKKEGDTLERCARLGWGVATVGVCIPVWHGRM